MTYQIHWTPKQTNTVGRAHTLGPYPTHQIAMRERRNLLAGGLARYWNAEIAPITH